MPQTTPPAFHNSGKVAETIGVELSYQIIALFSEGLYSSPNKAIEELVSNAFDADASTVHVALSADRGDPSATIAVIDDGIGMDALGLRVHWIVGQSVKATKRKTGGGRKTIGKFGIGKLAAYVLGQRLTHISKVDGKFYSTSMDFGRIPKEGVLDPDELVKQPTADREAIQLDLRILTEEEAKVAVSGWLTTAVGLEGLDLFGDKSSDTWTVAVISELKELSQGLRVGRLGWILSTAMPMSSEFDLYLNNAKVTSSKLSGKRVGTWVLGKDLKNIPKPSAADFEVVFDAALPATDPHHWSLVSPKFGPIYGRLEVFETPLDTGKSQEIGRSHGFFVYVNGRLINSDDPGFSIDRNKLRHGTFSRFRFEVEIDRLDAELRSSRESLREGPLVEDVKDFLQGVFNFARTKLDAHLDDQKPERQAAKRFAESPAALTERPLLGLMVDTFDKRVASRHIEISDSALFEDSDELRSYVEKRIVEVGSVVGEVAFEDLGTQQPIAKLDATTGRLSINLEHPFVAHFWEAFNGKLNLPLQLFAMAEVMIEAQLNEAGVDPEVASEVLDDREALLRHLAQSSGASNSLIVAQTLRDSARSSKALEDAVVAAFEQLGFTAIPKGRGDEPDGIAEAFLSARDNQRRHFRVSLEAKSKETVGKKVKKKDVEVSTIARHRDEANCDHAIVVGPDFETGANDWGALIREIAADREANPGCSITLVRIDDLARLVRLAPLKRLNLTKLRELLQNCSTPNESAAWIDEIAASEPVMPPYKEILETLHDEQEQDKDATVTYGALRVALRSKHNIQRGDEDLKNDCLALSRMAPDLLYAYRDRVELETRPDKVLEAIKDYVDRTPEEGK